VILPRAGDVLEFKEGEWIRQDPEWFKYWRESGTSSGKTAGRGEGDKFGLWTSGTKKIY
jgi:hypothetical protein